MARPDTFSLADITRMIGVSNPVLVKHAKSGLLKAARFSNGSKHFYRVHRSKLVSYLLAVNYPLDQLRRVLNPDGKVILCRTPAALQAAVQAYSPTLYVDSLFDLGRAAESEPAWACVVHLPEVGTTEAVRSLRPFYAEGDRPEIVGLVGDDGLQCASPIPFDTILPASSAVGTLAKSILTLRGVPG